MISGRSFQEICNWNLCNRYTMRFDINQIKSGDFIFINLDTFNHFVNLIGNCKLTDINLITHNSDLSFTQNHFESIKGRVNKIYAINCTYKHNQIVKIPLGFSDRLAPVISNTPKSQEKSNLIYINFNIHSGRIQERTDCLSHFSKFDWILYENLVPESQYYDNLSKSKYSACPIGAGLDTHRFYESIYFDTIPIVKRNDISDLHSKFPCVIVDDWHQIDNIFLENNYKDLFNKMVDWKKSNPNWMDVKGWI